MHEFAFDTLCFLCFEEIAIDEIFGIEFGDPTQTGFQRRGGVIDIMAIEAVPFLQTQAVTGTQTDRRQTEGFAYFEQRIPYLLALLCREIELETTGSGITCVRQDHTRYARETPLAESVIINGFQIRIGQQLQQLGGFRSLHG